MPPSWNAVGRLFPRSSPAGRLLFGCAVTAVATAARLVVDPLIHGQIPYFIYVASAVVATWFGGVLAGITGTLLAAFAGNYFFVEPQFQMVPSATDLLAMSLFVAVALGLVGVVSQWRAAEEASRRRAEELRALLDTVPAAVFVARDRAARHIEANRAGSELLRIPTGSNASLTGEPARFRILRNGAEVPPDRLPIREAARGATVRDCEFDIAHDDGTTRTLFGSATPLRDENGEVCGSVGAFVDVSMRKRAEEVLREADRAKDDFLATLSHELRTPLNAIVGWASMLVEGRLPPEAVGRAYEGIARNAAAQRDLIEDVLDVSRIVGGNLRLELTDTEVFAPLRAAIEAVRPAAAAKQIDVVAPDDTVPAFVRGDRARLQQVFWNLLANAVKFSADGGRIDVDVRAGDSHVEVEVRDHGIGISAEFLPHVFDRFRQHDSSTTRKHGGLGLGLSIVRHLVELHSGTVTARSEGEGTGTTMVVRLPISRLGERRQGRGCEPVEVAPGASLPDGPMALGGLRILVVDDQPDAREMVALVLANHGASVVTAGSAAEALDVLHDTAPDLLVVDLAMPGMDGYSLIQSIRAGGTRAAATPAIALSAYAREEDRRRALASGFQLHLAKPAEPRVLVRAVRATAGGPLAGTGDE